MAGDHEPVKNHFEVLVNPQTFGADDFDQCHREVFQGSQGECLHLHLTMRFHLDIRLVHDDSDQCHREAYHPTNSFGEDQLHEILKNRPSKLRMKMEGIR